MLFFNLGQKPVSFSSIQGKENSPLLKKRPQEYVKNPKNIISLKWVFNVKLVTTFPALAVLEMPDKAHTSQLVYHKC